MVDAYSSETTPPTIHFPQAKLKDPVTGTHAAALIPPDHALLDKIMAGVLFYLES